LVVILVQGLVLLAGCGSQEVPAPVAFEALTHRLPADATQILFLDLKPEGEAGRYWEHIRGQLEANSDVRMALDGLYGDFQVEVYGLEPYVEGPAANSFRSDGAFIAIQVTDGDVVEEAILEYTADVGWERETYQGLSLYWGVMPSLGRYRQNVAWTVKEGLWLLSSSHYGRAQDPLRSLLDLTEEDSLAASPSWQTLRERLPEHPMGLLYINAAEQARLHPPLPGESSLVTMASQQVDGLAFAAVPEEAGIRVEIEGVFALKGDVPPELLALFELPAVDSTAWNALPGNTALALIGHDATLAWSWIQGLLGLNTEAWVPLEDATGLDPETDLLSAAGPLTDGFALGVTPPLPDQPAGEGLTAIQVLILADDATEVQVARVRSAMESRGAIFGPAEAEGMPLQTQVGTGLSGYAISYGFDDGLLFFGSSPGVIERGLAARRNGGSLVETASFQYVLKTMPEEPILIAYVDSGSLRQLAQSNMTSEEYQNSEFQGLESLEAIGLGLRIDQDRLDGTIYFLIR
jgi:hypothetical protein